MTDETLLKLGDIVIPAGAGRGITQTVTPIENGSIRRTVNGELIDLTRQESRKYASAISAGDNAGTAPAFAGLWRGQTLVVECIKTIRQTVFPASLSATLIRSPVAGSVVGRDALGAKVNPSSVVDRLATFPSNVVMIEFRPILTMKVLSVNEDVNEYEASETWSLELEEV